MTKTAPPPAKARVRQRPVQPVAPVQAIEADALPEDFVDDGEGIVDLVEAAPPPKPASPLDDPNSEISGVLKQAQKRFGDTTIFRASTRPTFRHVSTGSFTMDMQMLGGPPSGLVTMLTGWKHSGKSTFGDRMTASFQKAMPDRVAAKVDIEGTYEPVWGAKHGMDNENLLLIQPTTGEDAVDLVDAVIRARDTSVVMIDSVAGLIPLKEIEASTEDSVMGKYAIMIGRMCRKIQQALLDERKKDHWVSVILVNQYRMSMVTHGDPRTLPGGKATEYLASYWYDLKCKEHYVVGKNSLDPLGADMGLASHNEHTITKRKNKLGNGREEAILTMIRNPYNKLGEGFLDEAMTVLGEAKKRRFIFGNGPDTALRPPYRIDGLDEKFRSLDEMVQYLYSDLDFYEDLQVRLISHQRAILGMESNPKNWRISA